MVANSPGSSALFLGIGDGVCLAIDAGLHDMVLADGAVVNMNVYRKRRVSLLL